VVGDSIKERKKYGNEEESQEDDEESIQGDLDGPGPEEGPGQEKSHQESRAEEEKEVSLRAATVAHEVFS
jgi:hypothetical protein